jgi:hypothetical protein
LRASWWRSHLVLRARRRRPSRTKSTSPVRSRENSPLTLPTTSTEVRRRTTFCAIRQVTSAGFGFASYRTSRPAKRCGCGAQKPQIPDPVSGRQAARLAERHALELVPRVPSSARQVRRQSCDDAPSPGAPGRRSRPAHANESERRARLDPQHRERQHVLRGRVHVHRSGRWDDRQDRLDRHDESGRDNHARRRGVPGHDGAHLHRRSQHAVPSTRPRGLHLGRASR